MLDDHLTSPNEASVVQQFDKYFAKLGIAKLLKIHLLICAAGLIVVSMFIAGQLARSINLPAHLIADLYPWAQPSAGVNKIVSLLQYLIPVAAMTVYLPLVTYISKKLCTARVNISHENFPKLWLFYSILIVINVGLLVANKERPALMTVLSLLWVIAFLWFLVSISLGRWIKVPEWIANPRWINNYSTPILTIVGFMAIASYLYIFIPSFCAPVVGHDYVNISQRTVLDSGRVVDNLDFINEHQIDGLQLYDPRKNSDGIQIKVEDCARIYQNIINSDKNNGAKLECDEKSNHLLVKAPFVSLEAGFEELLHEDVATNEEIDFARRNRVDDLENQKMKGWFFFHHGYNFGPMNAMSLGASAEKQTMVYGWLSTVTQGKILESLGLMNYQSYFKLFYSVYIIYFGIYLLGIWIIFKDFGTVVVAGLFAVSSVLTLGGELIKLAPGFNPARHFFDVPTFYLLYRYFSNNKKSHLFLAVMLALFAILWSKDLGLFLATSVGGALIVYALMGSRPVIRLPLIVGSLTVLVGLIIYLFPLPGSNPTAIYMILGIGAPIADTKQIFNLLASVGVLLLATILIKQAMPYRALTVGLAFYFVQGVTYYIWYPELHHLWGIAPVFIWWLAALYHGWAVAPSSMGKGNKQLFVVGTLTVFLFLPALLHFYKSNRLQQLQLESHQLYQWNFERADISSTMDPALFKDAAALIQKFNQEKEVYIISKYDHILPILAGRYSAMPYNELLTNLVSQREVSVAAQAILENDPQYLFVDTDIGRGFEEGNKNANSIDHLAEHAALKLQNYLGEAVARERQIFELNDVYKKVADRYQKCESSGLISVYCRKLK